MFERRLPDDLCDRLLQYALTHECKLRPMDGMDKGKTIRAVYHREAPRAVRYEFEMEDVLRNPDVQRLLGDLSLAAVAQEYLGSRPIVDILGLWWHTRFSDVPDAEAAQFFHFDMDRFKWLKFFIYLTDVETDSGPHSFVAGSASHRSISSRLLNKGYARLTDEEVKAEFAQQDIIEFVGRRGTISRGRHSRSAQRASTSLTAIAWCCRFQFSNSLFGTNLARASMGEVKNPALQAAIAAHPQMYAPYL